MSASALRAMRTMGLFSLAENSDRRSDGLLILCYHGLALDDEHEWWPHLFITPEQFRQRLRYLHECDAAVLPLGEALERLQTDSLPARSVAITFDDGFSDFLEHAVPALNHYQFPSTLYLTTHYCGRRLPIIGLALDYVLWKSGLPALALPKFGIAQPAAIKGEYARQRVVAHLLKWMMQHGLSTASKDAVAREIAAAAGVDYGRILNRRLLQILDPDEVRKTRAAGVDIQLHTHRHRTPKNRELFLREIEENRRHIIDLTGQNPEHFCYPSGRYAPEFFGWLAGCGVKSATTCEAGLAFRESPGLRLPRMLDDSGMGQLRFESVISGLFV